MDNTTAIRCGETYVIQNYGVTTTCRVVKQTVRELSSISSSTMRLPYVQRNIKPLSKLAFYDWHCLLDGTQNTLSSFQIRYIIRINCLYEIVWNLSVQHRGDSTLTELQQKMYVILKVTHIHQKQYHLRSLKTAPNAHFSNDFILFVFDLMMMKNGV